MRVSGVLISLAIAVLPVSVAGAGQDIDMGLGCASNPQRVGACFSVYGRLSAYNGNPSLRIWPLGTHRLLGVIPDEEPRAIPSGIRQSVGFGREVWGDFQVCPFTMAKAGHMQFVCVESVSNVRTHEYRQ